MANKEYPNAYFRKKICKSCDLEYQPTAPQQFYCSNSCTSRGYRNKYLLRHYGITVEQYEQLLEQQNHKCKICQGEGFLMGKNHTMKLVVDHCHTHGHVRGLLCHNCNRALGLLQESVEITECAVEYLKEGSETIPKGSTPK